MNLDGVTRMKGLEIEGNYDARVIYIGGTLTRIDTEFSDSFTSPSGNTIPINRGRGAAVIFEQPKLRVTLDAGVRLFEEKLTLGGRITDVSKTEPALGSLRSGYEMAGYRVYDIYGSYAFDPMTKLRFAVTNLTDVAYAPALGANSLPNMMQARISGCRIEELIITNVSGYMPDTTTFAYAIYSLSHGGAVDGLGTFPGLTDYFAEQGTKQVGNLGLGDTLLGFGGQDTFVFQDGSAFDIVDGSTLPRMSSTSRRGVQRDWVTWLFPLSEPTPSSSAPISRTVLRSPA